MSDSDDEYRNDINGTNRESEHETTDNEVLIVKETEKIPDSPNLFEQSLFTLHTPRSSCSNSPLLFSCPSTPSPVISGAYTPSSSHSTPPHTPSACGDVTSWKEMYRTLHKTYGAISSKR